MDMVKVGSFLQELRRQSNVTQEQLAERMGVARRTVSRWETGRNMPDLDILVELADFYEVDLREILNGERKGEHMNEELRETALQVAEYSGEEKLKITRRMHWLFLAGLASATVYLVLVLTNKADDFGGGLCLGIEFGTVIIGSHHDEQIRRKDQRIQVETFSKAVGTDRVKGGATHRFRRGLPHTAYRTHDGATRLAFSPIVGQNQLVRECPGLQLSIQKPVLSRVRI